MSIIPWMRLQRTPRLIVAAVEIFLNEVTQGYCEGSQSESQKVTSK